MGGKYKQPRIHKCEHDLSSTYNQIINNKETIVKCTIEAKYNYNGKKFCRMHMGYVLLNEAKEKGLIHENKS